MTKENHAKLEALSPEAKAAYIQAKGQILDSLRAMNLLGDSPLNDGEKDTVYQLLNETAFLMQSEEKQGV